MQTRIYVVINGDERRLVDASSAAQAIRHCVANKYAARPATPKDIAAHMSAGITVEKAGDNSLIPDHGATAQQQQTATF